MYRLFLILASLSLSIESALAISMSDIGFQGNVPGGSILKWDWVSLIAILTLIQSFLLKVVLPIIVIGASLYIAYELFTADGDESKLKKAWKSVAYTAVALVTIALSYGIVSIVSRLSI